MIIFERKLVAHGRDLHHAPTSPPPCPLNVDAPKKPATSTLPCVSRAPATTVAPIGRALMSPRNPPGGTTNVPVVVEKMRRAAGVVAGGVEVVRWYVSASQVSGRTHPFSSVPPETICFPVVQTTTGTSGQLFGVSVQSPSAWLSGGHALGSVLVGEMTIGSGV